MNGREFYAALTPTGELLIFTDDEARDTPDEVVLYDMDPRGFSRGVTPIRTWGQAVAALNQLPRPERWFQKGECIVHPAGEWAVFDGNQFQAYKFS